MSTRARPAWTEKYLRYDAWTQDELRNLLCGLPPNPAVDTPIAPDAPIPSRQETNDKFVRDELLRIEADRRIRDGVAARRLQALAPADERLLERVTGSLEPDEVDVLRRALTHERVCSKAYLVAPDAAIRWAAQRPDLFPDFPFEPAELTPHGELQAPLDASTTPKERRQQLVDSAVRRLDMTKAEFCRTHKESGLTVDILRAVVNADRQRADVDKWTPIVLKLLNIPAESWHGS